MTSVLGSLRIRNKFKFTGFIHDDAPVELHFLESYGFLCRLCFNAPKVFRLVLLAEAMRRLEELRT